MNENKQCQGQNQLEISPDGRQAMEENNEKRDS